jgi:hypothetical protein
MASNSILTVGPGQQYATIAAAVAAAQAGDTVDVQAGTYTNDFVDVYKNITLQAVGGVVKMVATVDPPNGKAIIDEGGRGVSITINGFDISGAVVADGNGAAIRYEGGSLTLNNDYFHNNQDGMLAAADPAGSIAINNSEFAYNGTGDGYTHNLYVNDIANLAITGSYFHDANEGHEIKSRAENTTVTGSRIFDNNSTASYSIDLPNGGNATIQNDVIQQGPHSDNPAIIAYGEEGNLHSGTSVLVANDAIVNTRSSAIGVKNKTAYAVTLQNNSVYGLTSSNLTTGPATVTGTTWLASSPVLDTTSHWMPSATPSPPPPVTTGTGSDTLVLGMSEDAYQGDAQFTVAIDGQQLGGTFTTTALHASGVTQNFIFNGDWAPGTHTVTVSFLNDAYGGSPSTDRNLYVNALSYDGTATGQSAPLYNAGAKSFSVTDTTPVPGASQPAPVTTGTGSDSLVLAVSEDAWQGDARFTVAIDGQQLGGTFTTTALHASGVTQNFIFNGDWTTGTHTVAVTFLNDAYGGSPTTDRNLYVNALSYDGTATGQSAALYSAGSKSFSVTDTTAVPASVGATAATSGLAFLYADASGAGSTPASAAGSKVYSFLPGFGQETISDFIAGTAANHDLIDISALGVTPATFAADVHIAAGAAGSAMVAIGSNSIDLLNVTPASLNMADFKLA